MNEDKPQARETRRSAQVDALKERAVTHAASSTGGAIAGAVAGAAGGLAAGPVGSLVGAVGGAMAGAVAGAAHGVGEPDTGAYEAYWREHFAERPYAREGARYEDYEPAYRFAIREYLATDHARSWEEMKSQLATHWHQGPNAKRWRWDEAEPAVRDAWLRMYHPAQFR